MASFPRGPRQPDLTGRARTTNAPDHEVRGVRGGVTRGLRGEADPRWRWRESNPRPLSRNQVFSGRSLLRHFSAPTITKTSRRAGLSYCGCPQEPRNRALGQWPSSRCRTPGRRRTRVDSVALAQAARANADCSDLAVIGLRRWFTRSRHLLGPLLLARRTTSKPVTPYGRVTDLPRGGGPSGTCRGSPPTGTGFMRTRRVLRVDHRGRRRERIAARATPPARRAGRRRPGPHRVRPRRVRPRRAGAARPARRHRRPARARRPRRGRADRGG